jgi:hypothetical protein
VSLAIVLGRNWSMVIVQFSATDKPKGSSNTHSLALVTYPDWDKWMPTLKNFERGFNTAAGLQIAVLLITG